MEPIRARLSHNKDSASNSQLCRRLQEVNIWRAASTDAAGLYLCGVKVPGL